MSKSRFSVHRLTLAAVIAAAYAGLTLLLPIPQYGPVQFRLAEALTVLPFVCPAAAPGLFIGCLLANLLSPYGLLDMVVGSGATLIACLLLCALAELILCRKLSGERGEFAAHFAPPERETLLLAAGSVLLAGGGALLLVSALPQRGLAAIAAGATAAASGLGFLLLAKRFQAGAELSVLPVLPSMFFSVFFVLTVYLPAESDPVLARYYIPVLASALTAYAFSLLGGFLRKESSPRAFTFVADLAVLLCITALADANGLGELLLFAGCALVLASFLALRRETALDTRQAEPGNP